MSRATLEIAYEAFEFFAQGWATGDFQPFLNMLTDEFTFWYPYGKHRGKFTGREGKVRMVAKCREHMEAGDRLTFTPPHYITGNETTVVFEFESQGMIGGEPFQGQIAIALDVSGDKISSFREYFGDID